MSRNILGIATEEAAVGNTGIGGEGLHTGSRAQRRAWLVECDMTIRADTADEQVDTTCLLDHLLVVLALSLKVGCITIKDMYVLLWTVDMIEQVASHESVVALRVSLWQAYVLVHVEGDDILERNLSGTIGLYQCIVHANR